jgi:hypothetical protein
MFVASFVLFGVLFARELMTKLLVFSVYSQDCCVLNGTEPCILQVVANRISGTNGHK